MAACRAVIDLLSVRALRRWSGAVWHARVQPQACPGCRAGVTTGRARRLARRVPAERLRFSADRDPRGLCVPDDSRRRRGRVPAPPADRDELVEQAPEFALDVDVAVGAPDDPERAV